MKRSIQARREKVSYYLLKGTPEARIAELVGVHRNTVSRDLAYFREAAREWLDGLAKDGFIREYQVALDKLRDHEFELQKILPEANVWQRIQILKALDENTRLYLELLSETPAVHAFKRALRRFQEGKSHGPDAEQG
jgi:hypothetical protein